MQQFDFGTNPVPAFCQREGPQPRCSDVLPFRQLDQWPPAEIHERLLAECADLEGVRVRESRMALPGTRALYLPDEIAGGPPEAFIDLHEFCHLHPLPEGSIHLVLPPPVLDRAVALGWAQRHPIAAAGILNTLVMVYAPRSLAELEVALGLIRVSCHFAAR
jgi:hypothetical protein